MKIALVRGGSLNRFDMQAYEPMASRHELTGYSSSNNPFELDIINFKVKKLHTVDEYYGFLPSAVKGLLYGLSLPWGMNNRLLGLEKELEDKDIIHSLETYNGYSYQSARVRREKNKKLVLTVWENIPFQSTKQFRGFDNIPLLSGGAGSRLTRNEHIVKYVKDNTDLFIAVTERARSALLIEGVAEDKIRVVPAGIDTDRFRPLEAKPEIRERLGVAGDDFVVLFTGRLTREKGVYDLLYAACLLSKERGLKHVKIVMAGKGPERDNIARMIKTLGIESMVKLVGSFSYEAMPGLYNAADVFLLPSISSYWWQEQFGMVLVEAMASGVPVISTLSGSIPEVVGDSGILIQPNDPLSIYNEIKKLAGDPSSREKYSKKGRERALKMFDARAVAGHIESVYRELV